MVSSIAVLFGVPRSNGAMVALWAANLDPHEFIRRSRQEMVSRVRQVFGDDIAFCAEDDGTAVVRKMSAYGEKHGQNFDWQIFEI